MTRHLASTQYWTSPAGGNTGRLFLTFGGPVCADRNSNCPLDRVLTYKNLFLVYVTILCVSCLTDLRALHNRCRGWLVWLKAVTITECLLCPVSLCSKLFIPVYVTILYASIYLCLILGHFTVDAVAG